VQEEVEEVREAHKAAASAQMAGIAKIAQSAEIGTPRKKEQREDALAIKRRVLAPRFEPGTTLT
jgi:hypothetical protein